MSVYQINLDRDQSTIGHLFYKSLTSHLTDQEEHDLLGDRARARLMTLQLIICLPACSKLTVTFIPTIDWT